MPIAKTAVATGCALIALASPITPASVTVADGPAPEPLPCQPDPGLFLVTIADVRERGTEWSDSARYHENARMTARVTAVPVTPGGSARVGVTWTGDLTATHVANDGLAGGGHAVSTALLRVRAEGDDGSRIHFHALGHIAGTERPGATTGIVRVHVDRAWCH